MPLWFLPFSAPSHPLSWPTRSSASEVRVLQKGLWWTGNTFHTVCVQKHTSTSEESSKEICEWVIAQEEDGLVDEQTFLGLCTERACMRLCHSKRSSFLRQWLKRLLLGQRKYSSKIISPKSNSLQTCGAWAQHKTRRLFFRLKNRTVHGNKNFFDG